MKLKLKKKLVARTGKVKCVDFHPTFNWILLGLYDGSLSIYDYNSQSSVQYVEVSASPVRAAKFMVEKNYIICGCDDKRVRVYNYNTMEKIKDFEAHSDFIRSISVHYKDPLFLTSSDDTTINLYDANKDFKLIRKYEEHKDFVMRLATNPNDYSMFASASMDKKIKIWSFNAPNSQITLEGHSKGIGALAFCYLPDKPYLASGGDDNLIKVWDFTNKHCIFTFQGHEENLSSLCFHPELPLLLSGSEDCTCKIWNINTGKLEDTKVFGYDVIWDICAQSEYNMIGMGCDEATLVFQMGNDEPMVTFSHVQSKVIYSQQNNIFSINLKQIQSDSKNGEEIIIPPKQLGSCELFPTKISYSPNGRYVSILSDKEFIISTSGVYRSSCVGNCSDFSWNENESFVIKDEAYIKIFKDLKEIKKFKPGFAFDSVFGGPLIGVKTDDSIYMYDPDNCFFIRKIDVLPKKVIWNDKKSLVALICDDSTFILNVNFDAIDSYIDEVAEGNLKGNENGCEESFDMSYDINEVVVNGIFINNVFVYQNAKNKINYSLNEKIFNITTLNSKYFLLGYLESTNKLYLMNKHFQLISYNFPLSFIDYQIAILEKNFEKASKIYETVPEEFNEKIITFLEKFNYNEISYSITKNINQKFSLALKLKKLNDAWEISQKEKNHEKMKMCADLAIELGEFSFAENAMKMANDYSGLLLYYSSIQNKNKIKELAFLAKENNAFNIAFACFFQLNDLDNCIDLLVKAERFPEASLFCRTYCPNKLSNILEQWNKQLEKESENQRMTTIIINPINENNTELLGKSENINNSFYQIVSEGNMDQTDKFNKIYEYDTYTDLVNNKEVDIDKI